jgi:putative flavoprotein involved in K+ transport
MIETGAIVVGASQAGLAVSHELKRHGVDHLVLERGRIANGWHQRWDSFCLVTPNWNCMLPGFHYDGDDPDGFMPREDIVAYLRRYAASFDAPVREGVDVATARKENGRFVVETSDGDYAAESLVLATGAFQRPHIPAGADALPDRLLKIDLSAYTNPAALPEGDVLIIGSGQSGCQLAEELHQAGRRVVLSCGRAPWFYRRAGGHDILWWLLESGFLDQTAGSLPKEARLFSNPLVTGHDGGHDLNLRTLQAAGVTLVGRFLGADGETARFAGDLAASVQWGDERFAQLKALFLKTAAERGMPPFDAPDPAPFDGDAPEAIDLASFGTVLFTGGFRPDYTSWLPWADAFDDEGFPLQSDGASTVVPGLSFIGVHFLRKRKSSILCGVGEDATVVADAIAARH